jgi:type I restriction enzyme S subunit
MAFNQKCTRPDRTVDPTLGRPMLDPGPSAQLSILREGDLVVNSTGTGTLGRVGLIAHRHESDAALVADGHVTVVRIDGAVAEPRFVWYYLSTDEFYELANATLAVGSTNQTELGRSALGGVSLCLPPLDEQRRIVDILDTETARFDELLRELNHLRVLAAEHVSAKREWLFEASRAHGRPLTAFLQQQPTYGVLVPRFEDYGVPFVRVGDIPAVARGELPLRFISEEQSREYRRTVLAEGDVVVSVVGSLTHSAVVPRSLVGANVARAVCMLRPAPGVPADLVSQFVQTRLYQDQARLATGSDTAQPTLNMSDLRKFAIPLPLGNEERMSMVRELKSVESRATQLLLELDRQSLLLREHRQALITAAVTGGLDPARKVA